MWLIIQLAVSILHAFLVKHLWAYLHVVTDEVKKLLDGLPERKVWLWTSINKMFEVDFFASNEWNLPNRNTESIDGVFYFDDNEVSTRFLSPSGVFNSQIYLNINWAVSSWTVVQCVGSVITQKSCWQIVCFVLGVCH